MQVAVRAQLENRPVSDCQGARRIPWWERLRTPEGRVAVGLAVAVFGLSFICPAFYREPPLVPMWHQHLGAEYFNIARAMVDGRGFSDPFGEATGPTAWMPPLYPCLLGLVLLVTRSRAATAALVLTFSNLAFIAIGVTIYVIARRFAQRLPPSVVLVFYLLWLVTFNFWTFIMLQDVWILALEVDWVLILVYRYLALGRMSPRGWGLLGGVLALSSPTLTLAWASVAAFFAIRDRRWRAWLRAAALALVLVSPWLVRNAVVFHRLIPAKSNLFFDAYQANEVDGDGVYDNKTLAKHPFCDPIARYSYSRLGESEFVARHRTLFFELLRTEPGKVARKIANRAKAAFLLYVPMDESERGLVLTVERIVYAIPFLAWLGAVAIRGPTRPVIAATGLFCLAYLVPYVVVAFYVRYALPLTPILVLFVFFVLDRAAARLSGRTDRSLRAEEEQP